MFMVQPQDLVSTMLSGASEISRVYSMILRGIVRKDGKQMWLLEKMCKLGIES